MLMQLCDVIASHYICPISFAVFTMNLVVEFRENTSTTFIIKKFSTLTYNVLKV